MIYRAPDECAADSCDLQKLVQQISRRRFQPQRRRTSGLKKFEDKEHLADQNSEKFDSLCELSELSNVFVLDCTSWENISFEKARN